MSWREKESGSVFVLAGRFLPKAFAGSSLYYIIPKLQNGNNLVMQVFVPVCRCAGTRSCRCDDIYNMGYPNRIRNNRIHRQKQNSAKPVLSPVSILTARSQKPDSCG